MTAGLEAIGDNFAQKHMEAAKKSRRVPKLEITDAIKAEVIDLVRNSMDPEKGVIDYMKNDNKYSIVLAEAAGNLEKVKKLCKTGNYRMSMIWKTGWISTFMSQSDMEQIQPSEREHRKYYILIGVMKQNYYKNKSGEEVMGWNVSVHGVISMDEIEKHVQEQVTQDQEISEKVEEHSSDTDDN